MAEDLEGERAAADAVSGGPAFQREMSPKEAALLRAVEAGGIRRRLDTEGNCITELHEATLSCEGWELRPEDWLAPRGTPSTAVPGDVGPEAVKVLQIGSARWLIYPDGNYILQGDDAPSLDARVNELQEAVLGMGERLKGVAEFVAAIPADTLLMVAQRWVDSDQQTPLEVRRAAYARLVMWLDSLPL